MTIRTVEDMKSEVLGEERRLKFQHKTCECGHKFESHEAWDENEDECIKGCDCRLFKLEHD